MSPGLCAWEVVLPTTARSWSCLEMPEGRAILPVATSPPWGAGGQIQPMAAEDVGLCWHCPCALSTVLLSLWTWGWAEKSCPTAWVMMGWLVPPSGHLLGRLCWVEAPCGGMAARAELRVWGTYVCSLPSCQTAMKGGGQSVFTQAGKLLPLPSFWALIWGLARLLQPAVLHGVSPLERGSPS